MTTPAKMNELDMLVAPDNMDPVQLQKKLQELIYRKGDGVAINMSKKKNGWGTLTEVFKLNLEAISNEIEEIRDWLPWKYWKKDQPMPEFAAEEGFERRLEIAFEIIDIYHFMLNMWIALGFDQEDWENIFYTKQQENRDRQERGY